jgi:hypothetical protein
MGRIRDLFGRRRVRCITQEDLVRLQRAGDLAVLT